MFPQIPQLYSYTNPDYLDANRRGQITEEQAQLLGPGLRLLSRKFKPGNRLSGWIVILALLLFLVLQLMGIEISLPLILGALGLILVVASIQLANRMRVKSRQQSSLDEDLRQGGIREGVGTLQFQGGGYAVLVQGQRLTLPFGRGQDLAPGASYRFYYLPNSGMVLSAEALDEIPSGAVESGLTASLAQANGFKLSSLAANQRGELTREQAPALYSSLAAPLIFMLVPGGILFYQLRQGGYLDSGSLSGLASRFLEGSSTGLLVVGGILLAASIAGLVLLVLTLLDLLGGRVKSVEGTGYRKISTSTDDDGSQTTRLYYLIGGVKFRAQQKGFSSFEDGLTYRAYFTPCRKVLVNLEVVA